jgi:hypothetical protein
MGDSRFNQSFTPLVDRGGMPSSFIDACCRSAQRPRKTGKLFDWEEHMIDPHVQQLTELLALKDRIIELLEGRVEQERSAYAYIHQKLLDGADNYATIERLEELAEQRRLDYMNQCQELAERREFSVYGNGSPWRFACWLMFKDLWPFSIWYRRHDR